MFKRMVLGAVTNYTYHDIEPWLVSLKRSGFDGTIGLIVYHMKAEDIRKLEEQGVTIFGSHFDVDGNLTYPANTGFSIMIERFIHAWYFLGQMDDKPDYVLFTDVKDVIFQSNPMPDNFEVIDWGLKVAHENFTYENEPWSANNMKKSFGPAIYEALREKPIYCAGVIGAPYTVFRDLALQIYLICRGAPSAVPGGGGPDQAALNIILSAEVWEYELGSAMISGGGIVHMGTTKLAIEAGSGDIGWDYVRNGTDYASKFIKDDKITITNGKVLKGKHLVPIVHQWNRVPALSDIVNVEYRE